MAKRLLDLVAASLGLLLLAPLFLLIAIVIKLDTRGPIFFRQERVGRHGVPFRIFKFRTMTDASASRRVPLTPTGDGRVTRVGTFLRRFKLDELAQLLDVFRGTMSLVGPRPEVPRYVEHYPPAWRERLFSVRPGITDFASVRFRDEGDLLASAADPEREYIDVILPTKLRYSLYYVDNPSLANDLRMIGLTLRTVVAPSHTSSGRWFNMDDSRLWIRLEQLLSTLNPRNRVIAMVADALTVLACWQATYLFRLGFERWQPGRPWYDDYVSFGVVAVYLVFMALTGVPRGPWRFFGFDDFKRITAGCAMAGLVSAVAVLMAQLSGVARAVLLLHPLFCVVALSLLRMAYRMVWEHARSRVGGAEAEPRRAIVLGAGGAARRLIAEIHRRDGWTVLALLDDDPAKKGLRIGGVSVAGTLADLTMPHVLMAATHVIVAMPGATPEQRDRAIALARHTGLAVMSVPSRTELQAEESGARAA